MDSIYLELTRDQDICVQNWSSTCKKKINIRKFEKQTEDIAGLLTEKKLHAFDFSEMVDECRQNLKICQITSKPPNVPILVVREQLKI